MRRALTRAPLEGVALGALAAAAALFVFVSSNEPSLQRLALDLRWLGLLALAGIASIAALARPRLARVDPVVTGLTAFLGALALVSATWSPYPRLTLERGGTFVLALVVAGAFARLAAGRPDFARSAAGTLVGVASGLAVAGFAVVALDRDRAIQGGTDDSPARLQGLGMNPNTASLLYAITVPLAVWLAFDARSRLARAAAGLATLVTGVSLFASGSRGATVASFLGVLLLVLLLGGPPLRRLAFVGATVVVYVLGVAGSNFRSLQPEFVSAVKPRAAPAPVSGAPGEAPLPPPTQGKELAPGLVLPNVGPIGTRWRRAFPYVRPNYPYDIYQVGFERPAGLLQPAQTGIFRGSGRLQVWQGALVDVRKRPFLGFGFGLEEQVFVDRYYAFEGSRPENSYLGWLLQLGVVGAAVFSLLGAALVWLGFRRRGSPGAPALTGAVLAGFAVSMMQSWVYSIGNIASLPFWVLAGLLAGAVARPLGAAPRRRVVQAVAGAAALLLVLAAAGRIERAHWVDTERDGMHDVYRAIGSAFLVRTVSDVWDANERPGISCVRYADGGDPYAMQFCFDQRGRAVETYDERSGKVVLHDLHEEPEASGLRIDLKRLKDIRTYVVSTQDEMRRAEIREKLRQALRKARADRT